MATALGLKAAFEEVLDDLREDIEEDAATASPKRKNIIENHGQQRLPEGSGGKGEGPHRGQLSHQRDAMLELLLAWMGDVVRHRVRAESFDLPEYVEATRAIAERSTIHEATRRMRALNKLERHLHTNVNEALAPGGPLHPGVRTQLEATARCHRSSSSDRPEILARARRPCRHRASHRLSAARRRRGARGGSGCSGGRAV